MRDGMTGRILNTVYKTVTVEICPRIHVPAQHVNHLMKAAVKKNAAA